MEHNLCVGHAIKNLRMLTNTYIKLLEEQPELMDCDQLIRIITDIDNRLRDVQDAIDSHMAEL